MLKKEFERLYGSEVRLDVYKIIEEEYMQSDFIDEDEFVKYARKSHIVERSMQNILEQAEQKLAYIKQTFEDIRQSAQAEIARMKNRRDQSGLIANDIIRRQYLAENIAELEARFEL